MNCPRCRRKLRAEARNCLCGWSQAADSPVIGPECAHAPQCTAPAILRLRTKTGWANFCYQHYIAFHTREAEAKCLDAGLETTAQRRAFCLTNGGRIGNRNKRAWMMKPASELAAEWAAEFAAATRIPERTPGEDDELIAA